MRIWRKRALFWECWQERWDELRKTLSSGGSPSNNNPTAVVENGRNANHLKIQTTAYSHGECSNKDFLISIEMTWLSFQIFGWSFQVREKKKRWWNADSDDETWKPDYFHFSKHYSVEKDDIIVGSLLFDLQVRNPTRMALTVTWLYTQECVGIICGSTYRNTSKQKRGRATIR